MRYFKDADIISDSLIKYVLKSEIFIKYNTSIPSKLEPVENGLKYITLINCPNVQIP